MRSAAAVIVLALLGCIGEEATSWPSEEVQNARVEAPANEVGVDLRIGPDGGRALLSDVIALEVGAEGQIYVLDYLEQALHAFDEAGAHLWTAGGRGQGPGEFDGAAGLAIDPDERVWVWDPRYQRFSVYDSDGTLVQTHPRRVRGTLHPWPGGFTAAGSLVDWAVEHFGSNPRRTRFFPVATTFPGGDTTWLPPIEYRRQVSANGRTGVPFAPGVVVSMDGDRGLLFAHTETYRILVRSLAGDTLRRFSVEEQGRPVTRAELDSVVDLSSAFSPDLRLEPTQIPRVKPLILRVFATPDGSRTYVVPDLEGHPAGSVLDAFDPGGRHIGRYRLPEPVSMPFPRPVARGEFVYYASKDPTTDLPSVLRVRIDPPTDPRAGNGSSP